jgi:hypothetical protein
METHRGGSGAEAQHGETTSASLFLEPRHQGTSNPATMDPRQNIEALDLLGAEATDPQTWPSSSATRVYAAPNSRCMLDGVFFARKKERAASFIPSSFSNARLMTSAHTEASVSR